MDYESTICRFYTEVSGKEVSSLEDIPEHVVVFLSALDLKDMKKPFVLRELRSGKSEGKVCIRLGVDRSTVRWIKTKFGL